MSGGIDTVAQAIQTQEGYFPGSTSYKNNNPGNLVASSWTQKQPGYVGVDAGGFAVFSTADAGTAAMDALITNYANAGYTVQGMMSKWAPAGQGGNDPVLYASNVATAAGVTPDTPLASVLSGDSGGGGGGFTVDSGSVDTSGFDASLSPGDSSFTIDPVVLGLGVALGALLLLQA